MWVVWQYTSCGIAKKYGVPRSRVDLDVFRGTPDAFLNLAQGTWTPEAGDMMPVQEPSQTIVNSVTASSSVKPVIFTVDVLRPTGTPVVTGTVKFVADPLSGLKLTPVQSATRGSSGSWTLTVKGLPAGTWNGSIVFGDISGTHATSSTPVQLTITQGVTPTPTIKPSPSPKPTSKPTKAPAVDPCRYQIKN
jgi:lysozyme